MSSQVQSFISESSCPRQQIYSTNQILAKNNSLQEIEELSNESRSLRQQAKSVNSKIMVSQRVSSQSNYIPRSKACSQIKFAPIILTELLINRLIEKFKQNLLTKAYVIQKHFNLNTYERYMRKKAEIKTNDKQPLIPVFQIDNKFFEIWDFINIFVCLVIIWVTPFIISFDSFIISNSTFILIAIVQGIDILLNMNKTILVQGQMVSDRSELLKIYLHKNFLFDITSLICWIILFTYIQNKYVILDVCFILLQYMVTFSRLQRNFNNHIDQWYIKGSWGHLFDLGMLIISIYFYAHFCGCIWHYVSYQSQQEEGQSWLVHYDLLSSNLWVRYNYAFYWATMTITTVGYGDITAQNQLEMIYSEIMMFFSSCVFAYSMNSIGIILKSIYDTNLKYKLTLTQINSYMSRHQINSSLQNRIRSYLKYFIEKESKDSSADIDRIVSNLPETLQYELMNDVQMKVISQMRFLRNSFSKKTQMACADALELIQYTPGDLIYKKGDRNNQYIYFIASGGVELVEEVSEIRLKELKQKDCFGFFQFFTGFPPRMTAKSAGFSEIYRMDRQKFINILQFVQSDYEIFHHIKDEILFKNDFLLLDQKCTQCGRYSHQEIDCPLLQYKPDMEQRIKKDEFYESENFRTYYIRNDKQKIQTLKIFKILNQTIQYYTTDQFQSENYLSQGGSQLLSDRQSNDPPTVKSEQSQNAQVQFLNQNKIQSDVKFSEHSSSNNNNNNINIHNSNRKQSIYIKNATSKEQLEEQRQIQFKRHSQFMQPPSLKRLTYRRETIVKEVCMLDELKQQFSEYSIDSVANYKKYSPKFNIDLVIKHLSKKRNKFGYYKDMGKYTFYATVKMKAIKLKQFFIKSLRMARHS